MLVLMCNDCWLSAMQTMDMTLGQVHDVLARSSAPPTHPSSTSHIQEIVFPPHIRMPAVNARRSIFTGFQSNIVS